MNRELKFRHYNYSSKKMEYSKDDYCLESYFSNKLYSRSDDMQFTGLVDKNGFEVYEGDLLENLLGRICVVEWNKYQACWDSMFVMDKCNNDQIDKSKGFKNKDWLNSVKVIGNIYENKELLDE